MKKFLLRIFAPGLLLLLTFLTSAQNRPISGIIINEKGEPVTGATVLVKGTRQGTSTNNKGEFSLSVPPLARTLVISSLDYTTQEVLVTEGPLRVTLTASNARLEDVVVIGYGTQKVTKVSGAISTIKASDIEKVNAVRIEDVIQGRASGVTVIQNGSPGSTPTVLVRGIPSYAGGDPLVVVDGVIQTLADFNAISPSDIESVNVLKDAATTAIYGVKGGNGILMVTTRSGKKNMKPRITLNSNYGYQEVAREIGVLNATEYGAIVNEGSTTSGGGVIFPNLSALGTGTNWQDQVFKSAPIQLHSLSASGGSDKVSYFLAASYTDQAGILGGRDKSDYSRGNFTANLDFQLAPKLKFIVNATGVLLNSRGVKENAFNSIIGEALNFDPTVPVLNKVPGTTGTYGFSNLLLAEVHNPLTEMQNTYNKTSGNKLYGKFELQYEVIKGLKLTTRFGYTKYDDNGKTFTPLIFYGVNNVDNSMNADGSTVTGKHNSVSSVRNSNFNYDWETFANYDFNVAQDHHFQAVAGFAFLRYSGNQIGASKQDVPFNSWTFADLTAATGTNTATNPSANSGYYYEYFRKNMSYFGRINYDYKDRYLASFSARRDGSYAFGADRQYGNFYSGSLGWVISRENFFHSDLVDLLKIRGSYGTTGNDGNTNPQSVTIATGGPYNTIGNSNGYNFGNVFYPGASVGSQANPLLGWESQAQFNAGLDIAILKNRLSLSADYYTKKVSNLLFTTLPALYIGTVPTPPSNVGTTSVKGIDATLNYNEKLGRDLTLTTGITFTTARNLVKSTNADNSGKIVGGSYFNGQSQTVTVFEKGQTPGYFYGYKTAGLFQTADEVTKSPAQAGAQPGDIKYVDVNKDGVIDSKDQTKIGDPFPKFTIGWNLNLAYRHFDFTAFVYASSGNDIYRAYERNANYTNKFRNILARWTGPGSTNDARNPRYSFTDANNNARVSQRYVENGSFIKVKNLQLGYTLPNSVTKKAIDRIRVYVQVKNAFTFTKYMGYDPEIAGGIMNSGVDLGAYPQSRIYTAGLDVNF
ncbi:MAG TPA: TonB-dependent receptor [Puia sp.]|nr:TonB-dependent receptor [Puia sp.]